VVHEGGFPSETVEKKHTTAGLPRSQADEDIGRDQAKREVSKNTEMGVERRRNERLRFYRMPTKNFRFIYDGKANSRTDQRNSKKGKEGWGCEAY